MQRRSAQKNTASDEGWLPEFTPSSDLVENGKDEGYYGVPLLKKPKWRWQIALYFFFEGISAGCSLLASIAHLFGGKRHGDLARAGHYTAFLTLVPCPPLLIADLGKPSRFHHMMRVFKPSSPMNLGAWTLLAYSIPVTFLSARALLMDGSDKSTAAALVPVKTLSLAGIPLAIIMTSYPGVLLSTTSTPVWSRSRFLGALMACSSINTAVAACSLHLEVHGGAAESKRLLKRLETVSSICEAGLLVTYVATAKDAARPLIRGRYRWHFWLGAVAAGLIAPIVLKSDRKLLNTTRSVLSLVGGLALKWSLTHAGRESALDIHATHKATSPTRWNPGWTLE